MRKLTKTTTSVSAAAVIAAAGFAFLAPTAGAADDKDAQSGVPGVELNAGSNASDKGLPGVEMNVGRDGDQNNMNTSTLGAGPDTSDRPTQMDRN